MTTDQLTHDAEDEEVFDPAAAPWSAESLYRISSGQRRLLFLEIISYAVVRAERAAETRGEWDSFNSRLRRWRDRHWGSRPWPGVVNDSAQFREAVEAIATTFTEARPDEGRGVRYVGRRSQPLDR